MAEDSVDDNNGQFLGIVSQYMKDLSFENVNSMSSFHNVNEQPQIDVQLKVNVEQGVEVAGHKNLFRVSLVVNISAKLDKPMFILELDYVGEFAIEGFPENIMEPILYVECPRLLFPFVRCIAANTVSEGGFPPLYLSPVNFAELYQEQREALNKTLQ
ncbi:protein-export protein SecB [Alphaproteobacteria bacterium]|nr:protein-export protein SecB [Alphaproteobacteria bacterium]